MALNPAAAAEPLAQIYGEADGLRDVRRDVE
jgi:hypothetical protein